MEGHLAIHHINESRQKSLKCEKCSKTYLYKSFFRKAYSDSLKGKLFCSAAIVSSAVSDFLKSAI